MGEYLIFIKKIRILLLLLFVLGSCSDQKQTLNIAVASNFEKPLKLIIDKYQQQYRHQYKINIIPAASGILTSQILNEAPFDLFLSADTKKPEKIYQTLKLGRPPQIYAIGKLTLWIPGSSERENCMQQLSTLQSVVMANPQTAPYGELAEKLLKQSNIHVKKLVTAANISQSYLFTSNGMVEAGFVASSMVRDHTNGCMQSFNDSSLSQAMILLSAKADSLYQYILSDEIQKYIRSLGYNTL